MHYVLSSGRLKPYLSHPYQTGTNFPQNQFPQASVNVRDKIKIIDIYELNFEFGKNFLRKMNTVIQTLIHSFERIQLIKKNQKKINSIKKRIRIQILRMNLSFNPQLLQYLKAMIMENRFKAFAQDTINPHQLLIILSFHFNPKNVHLYDPIQYKQDFSISKASNELKVLKRNPLIHKNRFLQTKKRKKMVENYLKTKKIFQ